MSLPELVGLIFTFNLMTFGNGPVMVPLLQDNLVDQRGVLSTDQLLYAFTIARVTPGQANTYVAAIGYMLFGWLGALLVTLAILVPGYLMLPLLKGFERLRGGAGVKAFTKGLTSASVGLILAATLSIGRETLTGPLAWAMFLLALLLIVPLKWGNIRSLAAVSAVGAAIWLAQRYLL